MITIGPWLFDPASRRLIAGQDEQRLSPKAARVLGALAETPGQVWSRDALLERVWPNVVVGEEVLTHAVAELRKSLGDDFRSPEYVETVHKSGYRLTCRVEGLPADPDCAGFFPGADLGLGGYVAYLEACDLFERGGSRNMWQAAALFGSVLESDPGFAPAHVGMAKSLAFLAIYYAPGSADLGKALDHAAAARRGDPRSAEAHAAQGFVYAIGGDFSRALGDFRLAVRLDPASSDVHYLIGRACFAELQAELAGPMLERAAALCADDYHSLMLAGKAREMMGDDKSARRDFAAAAARIEPRLDLYPDDFRALCGLARCLVHLERYDDAATLMKRVNGHSDPINYHLACTYARAGETKRSLDILEEVVDHGWNHGAWLARDPDFDAVRQDRRFRRIAASLAPSG